MTEKKQQENILKKINNLEAKARVLSACVPLNAGLVSVYTWEEFDVAYQAYKEKENLLNGLFA